MPTGSGAKVYVYHYYAGVHFVLCAGPVDKIRRIFVQDKTVYRQPITSNTTGIMIDRAGLFGGDSGEGGIKGRLDVMFGGATQTKNAYLVRQLGDDIPAYRKVLSVILRGDMYQGNHQYIKPWSFDVERINTLMTGETQWYSETAAIPMKYQIRIRDLQRLPDTGTKAFLRTFLGHGVTNDATITISGAIPEVFNGTFTPSSIKEQNFEFTLPSNPGTRWATGDIKVTVNNSGLINAVHVLRECLTDPHWGFNIPVERINNGTWSEAALTCFNNGLGFSFQYTTDRDLSDFMSDVMEHINATIYTDRATGQINIQLLQKVTNTTNLLVINSPKSVNNFERKTVTDLVNHYTVNYDNVLTGKRDSVSVTNVGLRQRSGVLVSGSKSYSGIVDPETAFRIATRDMQTLEQSLYSCTIVCGREAENLHKGAAFILEWPDFIKSANNQIIMRVESIDLGTMTNGTITITATEDAFKTVGSGLYAVTLPSWESPNVEPFNAFHRLIMETPYFLVARGLGDSAAQSIPEGIGYFNMSAGWPVTSSTGARMHVTTGSTYPEGYYDFSWCFSTFTKGTLNKQQTVLQLWEGTPETTSFNALSVGRFIVVTTNLTQQISRLNSEIMAITAIDTNALTITVKRGVLDTIPMNHADSSVVYGVENFTNSDLKQYLEGEIVKVKVRTETSEAILSLAETDENTVEMKNRMHRPYPPANVRLQDGTGGTPTYYLPSVYRWTNGLIISWATRNRLLQTAGFVGFYEGNVTTEAGVTYSYTLEDSSFEGTPTGEMISSGSGLTGTSHNIFFNPIKDEGYALLTLWSVRGGLDSMQKFTHIFEYL